MNTKPKQPIQHTRISLADEYKELLPQVRLEIAELKLTATQEPIQKDALSQLSFSNDQHKTQPKL